MVSAALGREGGVARFWFRILLFAACAHAAPEPPVALFESRLPIAPLLEDLKKAGGDASHMIRPHSAGDLSPLESGARYKFVVLADGQLVIAPAPADAPGNAYAHPTLSNGEAVRTAGRIRIERSGASVQKVVVDPGSGAFCPSTASLQAALNALAEIGVERQALRVENRPAVCVDPGGSPTLVMSLPSTMAAAPAAVPPTPAPPEQGSRYGALMQEVGHRFEMLGKAERAGRYDLAAFELGEIEEVFEEDLPHAEAPRESKGVELKGLADAFLKTHPPELDAALKKRDKAAFAAAFSRASATCNGCHKASGHFFVEVPSEPGASVPKLDRVK